MGLVSLRKPPIYELLDLKQTLQGSEKVTPVREGIRLSRLHKSPIPMGKISVMSTRHHRADVFMMKSTARADEIQMNSMVTCSGPRRNIRIHGALLWSTRLERDGLH